MEQYLCLWLWLSALWISQFFQMLTVMLLNKLEQNLRHLVSTGHEVFYEFVIKKEVNEGRGVK